MTTQTKPDARRCGYRLCRKRLKKAKRAHAKFCSDNCRKNERNAALLANKRCRACGKPLSKNSKVYCEDHREKARQYKHKSD